MQIFTKEFGNSKLFRSSLKNGGYQISPHIHQHIELVYMLEGGMNITIDGKRQVIREGELCIIAPLRVHSMRAHKGARLFMSVFSAACVPDWYDDGNSIIARQEAIYTPGQTLVAYIKEKLPMNAAVPQVYLDDIPRDIKAGLYAIISDYCERIPATDVKAHGSALYSMIYYIGEHFRENITLASIGKSLGYNPKYLSQCLSQIPDISFTTLLNSCRIELSKTLLMGTNMRVIDIAYECGFTEERTFRRAFTSMVGYSPSEYRTRRRSMKKNVT